MNAVFLYILKSFGISVVLYLYYYWFLRGKKFHQYNRMYLLVAVAGSLLFPLIKVDWFTIRPSQKVIDQWIKWTSASQEVGVATTSEISYTSTLLWSVFGMVSLFFAIRMLFVHYKIHQLKKRYPKETFEQCELVITDLEEAPFSYFKSIFWKKSIDWRSSVGQRIFRHELAHVQQKHAWDKLFFQIIQCVFWFQPVFYLMRKESELIHEYLADEQAVESKDAADLAEILLTQYSPHSLSAVSPFFSSNIKKRLDMITKNHATTYSYARRLLALPLLFVFAFVSMVQAKNKEIEELNTQIEQLAEEETHTTITEQDTTKYSKIYIVEKESAKEKSKKAQAEQEKMLKEKERLLTEAQKVREQAKAEREKRLKEKERLYEEAKKRERQAIIEKEQLKQTQKELLSKKKKVQKSTHRIIQSTTNIVDSSLGLVEKTLSGIGNLFSSGGDIDEFVNTIEQEAEQIEKQAEKIENYFESEAFQSKISAIERQAEKLEKIAEQFDE